MNSAENLNICISNWKPWGKISTAVITQGFSLLTLQLQTRLKQPRMKGHKRMLLPQGRTLHVDGVSRLAREHWNYNGCNFNNPGWKNNRRMSVAKIPSEKSERLIKGTLFSVILKSQGGKAFVTKCIGSVWEYQSISESVSRAVSTGVWWLC